MLKWIIRIKKRVSLSKQDESLTPHIIIGLPWKRSLYPAGAPLINLEMNSNELYEKSRSARRTFNFKQTQTIRTDLLLSTTFWWITYCLSVGMSWLELAVCFGISRRTLHGHRYQLESGPLTNRQNVSGSLHQIKAPHYGTWKNIMFPSYFLSKPCVLPQAKSKHAPWNSLSSGSLMQLIHVFPGQIVASGRKYHAGNQLMAKASS